MVLDLVGGTEPRKLHRAFTEPLANKKKEDGIFKT